MLYFLLTYFNKIFLVELGQFADAISTAFVGFESDRTKTGFWLEISQFF